MLQTLNAMKSSKVSEKLLIYIGEVNQIKHLYLESVKVYVWHAKHIGYTEDKL